MVGLRLRRGVRLDHLARHHGSLEGLDVDAVSRLRRDGLLDPSPARLRLTDRGLELADHVAAELL
jgi:coproporphyrinogen III oxidase-like Fe-S oxidoreductase